jgi:hypothetical protein
MSTKYLTLAKIKEISNEAGYVFFEKGKKEFHRIIKQIAFRNHVIEQSYKYPWGAATDPGSKPDKHTVFKVWAINLNKFPNDEHYGRLLMVHECNYMDDAKDWVKKQG